MNDDTGGLEFSVTAGEYDGAGPCAVVSLAGRAGIGDSAWIRLLLERQAAQGPARMVIDLSRLSSMDWCRVRPRQRPAGPSTATPHLGSLGHRIAPARIGPVHT